MFFLPDPSKPPTPSELGTIAVVLSALFIVFGLVGMGFSFFSAPEKHHIAVVLRYCSGSSIGIGAFIAFVYWLARRFTQ